MTGPLLGGVDVGGTKIQAVVTDATGAVAPPPLTVKASGCPVDTDPPAGLVCAASIQTSLRMTLLLPLA